MLLHVHKDKNDQIDLHNIVNQFIDVNSRRKQEQLKINNNNAHTCRVDQLALRVPWSPS